jgi:hypothetical protein
MVIIKKSFFKTIITNVKNKCENQGPPPHQVIIFTNNNYHEHERSLQDSLNQNKNKCMPNYKYRSWNEKKQEQKDDKCKTKIQHDFIIRTKQKQNEAITRKHTQN